MQHRSLTRLVTPLFLLLACGDAGSPGSGGASLQMRVAASVAAPSTQKFLPGAASATTLESLKYHVASISICESMDTNGSGFSNPQNCIDLYHREQSEFPMYGLNDDWTPLANAARSDDTGYIDLLSASSRAQLGSATVLTHQHVRSYNYGIINWALPIKVKAKVAMNDGTFLYTHDGVNKFEAVGVDNWRAYFTEPSVPLNTAPAEEAVVLLPNGGNWFKFQSPFTITNADIDERRAFVLDLVFNPDGIVKGFTNSGALGTISQRGVAGARSDITVPMLDLAPVPHRASEDVMRESYRGTMSVDGSSFDVRLELYYVDGDAAGTVYGVDLKSLVNADTTAVPPELMKISFLDRGDDGALSFSSFKHVPVITGMQRVTGSSGDTHVALRCATHGDRAAVEGGAAIMAQTCPSPVIDLTLSLVSRARVEGGVQAAVGGGPDAGTDDTDAGVPDGSSR